MARTATINVKTDAVEKSQYSKDMLDAIKEAEDICVNPHLYKKYKTFKDLVNDLDCEDDV